MARPSVAIIGPGAVGRAVGLLLRRRRYPIVAVAGRSRSSVRDAVAFIGGSVRAARRSASAAGRADVIFITTPDRMIGTVCREIATARAVKRNAVVFHCSGAHGPGLLASARECGAHVAALHPLQSFASPEQAVKRMKGTWFTLDGDEAAVRVGRRIVAALGGKVVGMPPEDRALYHAALCVLSNYLVALTDLGQAMMGFSGMRPEEAARAALPLVRGTVENMAAVGVPDALTGPIARGDVATVKRHLRAIGPLPAEVGKLYCELGLHTVDVARRKGTLKSPEARRLIKALGSRLGG